MSLFIRGRRRAARTGITGRAPYWAPRLVLQPAIADVAGALAGAFRLTLTATSPDGTTDPAVFLYLARPVAPGATAAAAQFQAVCTATDLQQYPPGAPWPDADPPWFRLASMSADFRSRAELAACQAMIAAQVGRVLDDLASMAPQPPGAPIVVAAGGRSLTLTPTAQPHYRPGVSGGYRLTLAASAAVGVDPAIFLWLARTAPADPAVQYATFQKVCTPADLAALPATAPAAGADPAWFRTTAIALDFADRATAATAQGLVVAQAQSLLATLALDDQLDAAAPVDLSGQDRYQ